MSVNSEQTLREVGCPGFLSFGGPRILAGLFVLSLSLSNCFSGDREDKALLGAAREGDVLKVREALKAGANPNYIELLPTPDAGFTPLYSTIFFAQSSDCVNALLAGGADPLLTYEKKPWMSALAASCQEGIANREIFELLLSKVEKVPPDDGRLMEFVIYPLARRGEWKSVRRLESLGADLGVVSGGGKALFMAEGDLGHYEEAEKWLRELGKEYRNATNKVDAYGAIEHLAYQPYHEDGFVRLLGRAREYGLRFFVWRSDPIWESAESLEFIFLIPPHPNERRWDVRLMR